MISMKMNGNGKMEKTRLMVDGHVHIYDCYQLERFFKIANAYLDHYYDSLYANGRPYQKLLLLTEGKKLDYFSKWQAEGSFPNENGYRFLATGEETSLVLAREEKFLCYVIRGRQIVTRENLEVLSIASDQMIEDGLPIETVLDMLVEKEEPAVLAWGFGKWFFKRGKVIRGLIDRYKSPYLLMGDNSGRPRFWPKPSLFTRAEAAGIPLINGSDPLPFKEDEEKPGSFGFSVSGEFDEHRPAASLKEILLSQASGIELFGKRDSVTAFLKRQSKIYKKKYLKK